ncbi:Uncharacterized protein APZ42_021915 [Daphnia magna]|uniref:Uncharacterized protein n=1 Tax=Daphnia magna TaxID=35525 RepID=A0A164W8F8_9CRUS|nr:Uncharacterized protein APZ42_021915 [Daphnia magna]
MKYCLKGFSFFSQFIAANSAMITDRKYSMKPAIVIYIKKQHNETNTHKNTPAEKGNFPLLSQFHNERSAASFFFFFFFRFYCTKEKSCVCLTEMLNDCRPSRLVFSSVHFANGRFILWPLSALCCDQLCALLRL